MKIDWEETGKGLASGFVNERLFFEIEGPNLLDHKDHRWYNCDCYNNSKEKASKLLMEWEAELNNGFDIAILDINGWQKRMRMTDLMFRSGRIEVEILPESYRSTTLSNFGRKKNGIPIFELTP